VSHKPIQEIKTSLDRDGKVVAAEAVVADGDGGGAVVGGVGRGLAIGRGGKRSRRR
jgi:hypothetical protein